MSEFIKNRSTERGQIEIAKAILSLVSDKDYVKTLQGQEFKDNPASEYGQKAIANAIRAIGGQTVTTVTKTNPYIGNNASLGGQQEIIDAIVSVKGDIGGGTPTLQDVTVHSGETQSTVTAEEGYDGIGTVTVEALNLQEKTAVLSTCSTANIVEPDDGKDGLSKVTVPQVKLQDVTVTLGSSQVIEPDGSQGYIGLGSVTIPAVCLETVNVTLDDQAQTIYKGENYDGIGQVNIPAIPAPCLQSKSVNPTNAQQTITADSGYQGLSSVTVGADSGTDTLATAFSSEGLSEYTISGNSVNPLKIKKINLPNATSLPADGFNGMMNLEEVYAPNVTQINARCFKNASSVKKITFGTITSIGTACFNGFGKSGSTNQCDITISASIWTSGAFDNSNFRNITFSEITTIDYSTALGGKAVNASFPKVTTISGSFGMSVSSSGTLSMPELTTISDQMAFNNEIPNEITFEKLQTVKGFYFSTYLKKLTLPAATTIKSNAFNYATNFTDIYLPGSTVCALENINAFSGVNSNFAIHVPSDLEATYKAETNWSSFASKITGDLTAVGV